MIPIRLDQQGAVEAALHVAQGGAKNNLLDRKELLRQVMLHQERLTKCNLPAKTWDNAELLITPRVPGYNRRPTKEQKMQTAVWLKYHGEDNTWFIHGIYRTKEELPTKRIKIQDFSPEIAYKVLRGIIEHQSGIEVDGLTVFAIF